jgi:cytochrome c
VCHSIDANRIGPAHRGVVGRRSASAANFRYSPALQRLNVTWTPENLDRWLTSPPTMAPGTAMGVVVAGAQDRADIIAYLATQRTR